MTRKYHLKTFMECICQFRAFSLQCHLFCFVISTDNIKIIMALKVNGVFFIFEGNLVFSHQPFFSQHKCKYMHTIIIVFFIKRIVNRQLGSLKISFHENTNLRRFLEHIHPNLRIKLRDNRCISTKPVQTSCMYLSNSQ